MNDERETNKQTLMPVTLGLAAAGFCHTDSHSFCSFLFCGCNTISVFPSPKRGARKDYDIRFVSLRALMMEKPPRKRKEKKILCRRNSVMIPSQARFFVALLTGVFIPNDTWFSLLYVVRHVTFIWSHDMIQAQQRHLFVEDRAFAFIRLRLPKIVCLAFLSLFLCCQSRQEKHKGKKRFPLLLLFVE